MSYVRRTVMRARFKKKKAKNSPSSLRTSLITLRNPQRCCLVHLTFISGVNEANVNQVVDLRVLLFHDAV